MNCLDFRRGVFANPRALDEAALAHANECVTCREFLERQREMDADLYTALQVPVPDGLADRILVARGLRPPVRRWPWAIAASLLLTVAAAFAFRAYFAADPLGQEAIQHVALEPQSFTTVDTVGNDFLPAVLAEQGLKAVGALGQVTYTRICPMNGRTARHLVIRTAQGPVSLFLMPDDPKQRHRSLTQAGGMAAITMPARQGSIAIVAASATQAIAVENALRAI